MNPTKKKLLKFGGIITAVWFIVTTFSYLTAVEMEVLLSYLLFLVGGFILVSYFVIVLALTAQSKKGKLFGLGVLVVWLLIPVISYGVGELESFLYKQKLQTTIPNESLVKRIYDSEIDHQFLELNNEFFSSLDGAIHIKINVREQEFVEYAKKEYEKITAYVKEKGYENEETAIDELMLEDVFDAKLFGVDRLHYYIWEETTVPEKITVELYYEGKVIFQSSSMGYDDQSNNGLEKMNQFYKKIKPIIENN